jgi:hypothetical protein
MESILKQSRLIWDTESLVASFLVRGEARTITKSIFSFVHRLLATSPASPPLQQARKIRGEKLQGKVKGFDCEFQNTYLTL